MQTFMPYGSDYDRSAQVLDRQRLGKQRVEVFQIIQSLTVAGYGWKNHPAVRMWKGHVPSLALYGISICQEWRERGYRDSMMERIAPFTQGNTDPPEWVDWPSLVLSHRSNLIRKYPERYRQFWPGIPDDLPYVWPV